MDKRGFNELPVRGGLAVPPNLGVRIGALALRALVGVHRLAIAAFDWQWKRYLRAEERRTWSGMTPRQRADLGAGPSDFPAGRNFDQPWPP